jgi:hypothetical protein
VLDGGRYLEKFWPVSRKRTREKVAIIDSWPARSAMACVRSDLDLNQHECRRACAGVWTLTAIKYARPPLACNGFPGMFPEIHLPNK